MRENSARVILLQRNNKLFLLHRSISCLLHFRRYLWEFSKYFPHIFGMEIVEAGMWAREKISREFLVREHTKKLFLVSGKVNMHKSSIYFFLFFGNDLFTIYIFLSFFLFILKWISDHNTRKWHSGNLFVVNLKKWGKSLRGYRDKSEKFDMPC